MLVYEVSLALSSGSPRCRCVRSFKGYNLQKCIPCGGEPVDKAEVSQISYKMEV